MRAGALRVGCGEARARRPEPAVGRALEAKKALFHGTKLKSFHFVVYSHSGDNWLLWCGQPDKHRRLFAEWWQAKTGEVVCDL